MAEQAQTIGTARVDIVVNTDSLQAGIEAGKRQLAGFKDAGSAVQQELDRMTASQRRQAEQLLRNVNTLGLGKQGLAAFKVETQASGAMQDYLRERLRAASAEAETATKQFNQYGMTQKQVAAAMRGVPAQITDIVVSLQGGQRPLTVLLQQGGQLKDLFGGIRPAAAALASTALGLINPWTVAAATLGAVAFSAVQAESKLRDLNRLSTMFTVRGNALDVDSVKALIADLAQLPGVSRGVAGEVVAAFAQVRQVGPEILAPLSGLVRDYAAAIGSDVPAAAAKLADAFEDPKQGAELLDKQLNILTADQLVSIQTLLEHGRTAEAQGVLLEALKAKVQGLAEEGMTPLERAMDGLGNAWDGAMGKMSQSDALETINGFVGGLVEGVSWLLENLPRLASQANASMPTLLRYSLPGMAIGVADSWNEPASGAAGKTKPIGPLQQSSGRLPPMPGAQPAGTVQAPPVDEAYLKGLLRRTEAFKAQRDEASRVKEQIDELRTALEKLDAAGRGSSDTAKQLRENLAGAQEKYTKLTKDPVGQRLGAAQVKSDVDAIKNALREEQAEYKARASMLDTLFRVGGVAEADYYRQKRDLIEQGTRAEVDALGQQNDVLTQAKATGAQRIALDKEVAANKSRMVVVQREADAALARLDAEQQAAMAARISSLRAYRAMLEDLLATSRAAADRDVATAWMGGRAREYALGLGAIDDKYAAERRKLQSDRDRKTEAGGWGYEDEIAYQARLQELESFVEQERAIYDGRWSRLRAGEADWTNGAAAAFADYADQAKNLAGQSKEAWSGLLVGMTDETTEWAFGAEADFDRVFESFAKMLFKMELQAGLSSIFGGGKSVVGSLLGSGGLGILPNAKGNVFTGVPGLSAYSGQIVDRPTIFPFAKGAGLMGEAGPEGIFPLGRMRDGSLGVKAQMGSGDGVTVQLVNNGPPVRATATRTTQPDGSELVRVVLEAVGDSIASGTGPVPRAIEERYGVRRSMGM